MIKRIINLVILFLLIMFLQNNPLFARGLDLLGFVANTNQGVDCLLLENLSGCLSLETEGGVMLE